jgi:hypothetical protein
MVVFEEVQRLASLHKDVEEAGAHFLPTISIGFRDSEYGRSGVAEGRRRPGLRRVRERGRLCRGTQRKRGGPSGEAWRLSGAKPSGVATSRHPWSLLACLSRCRGRSTEFFVTARRGEVRKEGQSVKLLPSLGEKKRI